ncbi:aminotransferase class III-fold pyridoxal phosphate-dependent enzyme [Chitinophaga agrisoli]|uniref:Aminotransferase class III-fold pyridoxal phosphate-dependent enzyme n=1 Tax=Chitinophaga agrisoli TaxID=2607653 RepID=A0A5B2VZH7_9BACT|nr:aminotransferase class III-fold pyridoxal phosphate-dependent enzyme [Chitinophaga agrisoli]KAA2243537.1 aminotransferase class III-fold pyridoxal phosphate-dependent enzyme [Chitinophaga agrisoli]
MPNTISFNEQYPVITASDKLYARAVNIMTPVTQTLAKGPGQYVTGVAPKYLKRGKDAHVWDVDGNEYIDYNMGIGPLSLGYCYPRVDAAIAAQLKDGITFSMMHELEVTLAELVHRVIPNAEALRISKTGADVTSAAIRVARAFTGRKKVLCCGYHGWHDWYISVTSRNSGIPEEIAALTSTIDYNDIESVKQALDEDTACVILEPFVFAEPKDNFLQQLKEVCEANGTLLIFDEMWTGFRIAVGGAQEYFNVKADLACYSKAFANGMPISLLTGRKEIMQLFNEEVFFFTTFGGEALSLAAAVATINEMIEKNVPAVLAQKGKLLKDGYNQLAAEIGVAECTSCTGYDCRSMVTFNAPGQDTLLLKSFVQQELFKRGILWSGFHNMSFTHTSEDIEHTLAAYKDVLPLLKQAIADNNVGDLLKGKPVEAVFRKVSNFNTKPVVKA